MRTSPLLAAFCLSIALALPASAQVPCPNGSGAAITVTNLLERESVTHELLMVQGRLSAGASSVKVTAGGAGLDWPVVGGVFKALVGLQRGNNRVTLSAAGHADRCLEITFAPADTGHQILLVQLLAKDQPETSGLFRAPAGMPTDLATASKRYRFGALLAQSAVAELMHRAGRGRRTFALKRDAAGQVEVGVHRSANTLAQYRDFVPEYASDQLIKGTRATWPDRRLSPIGFFQMDSVTGGIRSDFPIHNFSSLYTWPQGLEDVHRAFTDKTRKTENGTGSGPSDTLPLWWHASYELGYMILVQGWRMGAPQNSSTTDVMGQGFRNFRHLFLSGKDGKPLLQDSIAFGDSTAGNLAFSPWMRAVATPPTALAPIAGASNPPVLQAFHPSLGGHGFFRIYLPPSAAVRFRVRPALYDLSGREVRVSGFR